MHNGESQALLKQLDHVDLLGDWNDGFLTIGTLGYDSPLKFFNQNNECFTLESEDELDHEDYEEHILVESTNDEDNTYNAKYEELNPLIHTTFEQNFENVVSAKTSNHDANNASKEIVVDSLEVLGSKKGESGQRMKKRESTTLAELFLADSNVNLKVDPVKVLLQSSEKHSLKGKHGMSFTKKFIPPVKDNPHPIKDIKKLVKKMLKSKIHPDLDVKNQKLEASDADIHEHGENDTTSLLPII
ncbi:hypothetical protein RIF29_24048 [Crotalaria pallida]|uniref:Protein TILLER ANGLE CONTROL 1 n=1 Tax=Crotalaria pallida TaxID=3830 RepID=A0AAN9EJU0_CROPI